MLEYLEKIFSLGYTQYKGKGTSNGLEVQNAFNSLEHEISNIAKPFGLNSKFSAGQGRWNAVPYIRVFYSDTSPSAQDGVYIVYLFAASGKSFFLTLNQGTLRSSLEKRCKIKKSIQEKISSQSFMINNGTLDFGDNNNYGEAAIFYKEYKIEQSITDKELSDDLNEMMKIYQECRTKGLLDTSVIDTDVNKEKDQEYNVSDTIEITKKTAFVYSDYISKFVNKNYITSLLAKPFVILAGNSGTGKTKISKDLALFLGKAETNSESIINELIVPVGADWTDNTKILGFYNPMNEKYQKTPILDFIIRANEHKDIPFFLIFDEMNLSQVERYFSDFLSKMELVDYSDESSKTYFDIDQYGKIEFPKNLFITGTVNIDETTYMFSPKVLDRANVIEFVPNSEMVLNNFKKDLSISGIKPANNGSAEGFLALAKEVRRTTALPDGANTAVYILTGISDILTDSGFEFAYRTTKEIRLYLNAAAKLAENEGNKLGSKDYIHLMDEQLLQKILPKIHGNRSQIGELLRQLSEFCETQKQIIDGKEFGLIESKKKIDRMIKQLETSQFASFM